MTTTSTGVFILFYLFYGVAVSSDWHLCLDKCYFLSSKVNISYTDQAAYCQTMGRQSKPVDFGSKLEQSLEAELNTCRLPKIDNEPYWINKKNIQDNKGTPSCRTITFSGNNIHLEQDVSCSALSHPFCETEKSFCQSSGNKNSITHDWVKVAGQSSLYKLSSSTYPYCEAKTFCQKDRHGKIASVGNYSFMGLLATELGISGTMKLDVWLDSPGITCPSRPSRPDKGSVMRYTGPLVHLIESWNAGVDFNVLCETNTTTVAFQTEPRPTLLTKRSTTLKSNRFPTTTTLNMTSVNARNQTTQTTSKMNITSPNTQKPTTPTASELTIMRSVNTQNSSTPATSQTNTQNPITPTNTQSSTTPTMSQTNNQNPTTLTNTQNPTTPAMSQTNNQNPTTPTNTQNPTKTTTTMSQINTPYPTTPTMLQTNSHNPTTPTILKTDTQNQTTPITLQTNKTLPNTHNPNTPTTSHINMTLPNTQNLTTTTTTTTTTTSQTNTNSLNTRNLTTPATSQTNTTSLNTRNPTTPATSQTNTTSQSSVKISTTQKETSVKPKTTAEPSNTQSVTSSTVSSLKTASGQEWTTVGQEEYFINYDPMSYNKAARFCHEMKNASLVKFLDPIRYFTVLAQIALRNSSFWVGGTAWSETGQRNKLECFNGSWITSIPCCYSVE
ncbi:uncharacterized protein LOC123529123 isoform X2 [Mercenaria mercenaria]|uniref:uncharacterized protein LOC123529123 isoform X2 n=1 Tax=Mercenaria mercenaria TaxID=6596 RepID=UPI00234F0B91|nr:uncharacterized protein LOC123529123 isoform X2 [Mercenaria mercenaria]